MRAEQIEADLGTALPIAAPDISRHFSQGRRVERSVTEILDTLTQLGQAEKLTGGYVLTR